MSYPAIRCTYLGSTDAQAVGRMWALMRCWLALRSGQRVTFDSLIVRNIPVTPDTVWGVAWSLASQPGHELFVATGAGAFAGSNVSPGGGGVAVVGDAVLDELVGRTPSACRTLTGWGAPQCSRDGQTGAALHELLHTFGLRHEDGGIMERWWDWPSVALPKVPLGPPMTWWQGLKARVEWAIRRF